MNTKKAKALRRELRYHPSQPRSYVMVNKKGTIELSQTDKRFLYQEIKKEAV